MLRTSRTIAKLIRCLALGTVACAATATASTVLVGCKDESQPEYWVDKLDDPTWRPRAIKRLEQFYEDTITKANKNQEAPEVQALLNKIVDPLTKTYVENYGDLDTKTRVALIKLLASFRDKRTEPAIKKAFEEFAKRPATQKDDADIKWAARAAAELKLESVAGPMLDAFQKLKASTMLGGVSYRDFNEAMVAMPQKSWTGPLIALLEKEVTRPENAKDKDGVDKYRDQLFWQTTSAQVLGELEAAEAVQPLMKVMLDPNKADVAATAILALVKIGKPSVDAASKLITAEPTDSLAAWGLTRIKEATKAKEPPKDKPYVATAAIVLGTVGRPEALPTMIGALEKADNDTNRAVIARELTKIPATSESKQAFKTAYEKISIESVVPPGLNALQMLTEAAGQFYDPTMVPWLLERAEATKGAGEDKKALQTAITVTALKLAKPDQLDSVKAAVDKYGTKLEKDLYEQVEKIVKACGDRSACYLAEIEKSQNQDQKNQFVGIKAGYMLPIYGNEQTRGEVIQRLESIDNASVRFVAAQAIDALSPKGSKEAATTLKKIIDKNVESADQNKIQADAPLKQVMYRIEARAD
jgi:HEAT repeat protein